MKQGLEAPLQYFAGKSIRVATMCSGTESPLLALELISTGEFFVSSVALPLFASGKEIGGGNRGG